MRNTLLSCIVFMFNVGVAGTRGYGSVAERDLPKVETRVRFPLPAQILSFGVIERLHLCDGKSAIVNTDIVYDTREGILRS